MKYLYKIAKKANLLEEDDTTMPNRLPQLSQYERTYICKYILA
jgi:hypothetical protein